MQNSNVIRTRSRQRVIAPAREIPWSFMLLVMVCACVVAAGFFFAARQHFTSMDYGIKNSKLREQLESLEAEKRRLLLAREIALSPVAVRKAAKEIGLRQASEEIVAVQVSKKPQVEVHNTAQSNPVQVISSRKVESATLVPTVMSRPVQAKPSGETRRRVVEPQKEKKEKVEVAALLKLR